MKYWQSCDGSLKARYKYQSPKSKDSSIIDLTAFTNSESWLYIGHVVGTVNLFTDLKSSVNRHFYNPSFGKIN